MIILPSLLFNNHHNEWCWWYYYYCYFPETSQQIKVYAISALCSTNEHLVFIIHNWFHDEVKFEHF